MSAPVWKWDVTSESTGTELVLTSDPFFLLEQSFPMPDVDVQYASSVDSTRDALTGLRYKNRTITLRVRVVGSSASNLETQLSYVAQKVAKTNADTVTGGTGVGATLQYTSASGDAVVFDVVHAQMVADTGQRYVKRDVSEVTITFECLPFWRGVEQLCGAKDETTLPYAGFTAGLTNLVPNPSFETNTTSWGSWYCTAGTFTRPTDAPAWASPTCLDVACPGSVAGEGAGVTCAETTIAGQTYTFRVSVKSVSGSTALQLILGDGGSSEPRRNATKLVTATGSWVEHTTSFTAPTSGLPIYAAVLTVGTTASTFRIDAAMVSTSADATYFDGGTSGCYFAGTAHGSVSVNPTVGVPGDVPALGRLLVDEDQAKDQLSVVYGLRSKNYSADATAALFWQAESLTAVAAGAAAAAGPSGASGSGSNTIYANALTTTYQDLLKSTVSTTYWTHVGSYRVIVRAQAKSDNTGTVTLRAKWAQADVTNYTTGSDVELPAAGSWARVDLGVITIPRVLTGTQRWELRVQGKSSVNLEDVYVDWVWLVPVDECSGVAEVSSAAPATTLTVQDTFEQTAGNLNGKTPSPVTDGNWAESSAGKFTIDTTNDRAQRTGTSDSGSYLTGMANGAFATASTATTGQYANVSLHAGSAILSDASLTFGALLRYTDASNWAAAVVTASRPRLLQCVAGTVSQLASFAPDSAPSVPLYAGTAVRIESRCSAAGLIEMTLYYDGVAHAYLSATDSALATSGTLASGKIGIVDHYPSATALTRGFSSFEGGTVTSDAACFASQSIQVRHDGVVRSTASGIWSRPARFDGDYLLVPPSGREARTVEVTVGMSRTRLGEAGDSGTDDLSAKLYVSARGLQLPS